MSLWKSYLKRNLLWITVSFLVICVQELFLYLVGIRFQDEVYLLVLEGFLVVVIGTVDFFSYKKRVKQLRMIARQAVSDQMEIPDAADAIEEGFHDIVENIGIDRKLTIGELQRKQQEMQEYYAMWVHQIKTPIAAMQLLLQMKRAELESEAEFAYLYELEDELFRIEQYVNMALQFQRIQAPGNDFVFKKVSLDKVIREVIRKYAKVMIRKKIPLNYAGTNQKAVSDEKWLGFVVEQILSNAIKYSKETAISIDVINRDEWCYIQIADHGIGIREEDIPRVFEKGYTGYNGHSDKRSTGIGLYLSKMILEKIGHSISIESEIGKGTTVLIGLFLKEER